LLRFFGLGAASTLVVGGALVALSPSARGAASSPHTPRTVATSPTDLGSPARAKAVAPLASTDPSSSPLGGAGKRARGRSRATQASPATSASVDATPHEPPKPTPLARPHDGAEGLPRDISPGADRDEEDETRAAVEALERAQGERGL